MDAFLVDWVFDWLQGVPAMAAILDFTGTTAQEALIVVKRAGCDHTGTGGSANGAAM